MPVATRHTLLTDTFTRADETPLAAPWVGSFGSTHGVRLHTNAADVAVPGFAATTYGSSGVPADQWSKVTITAIATGAPQVYLILRDTGSDAYILTSDLAGSLSILRYNGGAFTSLATGTGPGLAASDTLAAEIIGTNLALFQNDISILTVSNAALASGDPGFACYSPSTATTVDDWAAGDFVASVVGPKMILGGGLGGAHAGQRGVVLA